MVLLEYATLKEYINDKAKKVIWIFYGNDFYNLRFELKNETLINYLNNPNFTQNLKTKQNEINKLINKTIKENEKRKINKKPLYFFKIKRDKNNTE